MSATRRREALPSPQEELATQFGACCALYLDNPERAQPANTRNVLVVAFVELPHRTAAVP